MQSSHVNSLPVPFVAVPLAILDDPDIDLNDLAVWISLASQALKRDTISPSVSTIARRAKQGATSVRKAMGNLTTLGLIERRERYTTDPDEPTRARQTTNQYKVFNPVRFKDRDPGPYFAKHADSPSPRDTPPSPRDGLACPSPRDGQLDNVRDKSKPTVYAAMPISDLESKAQFPSGTTTLTPQPPAPSASLGAALAPAKKQKLPKQAKLDQHGRSLRMRHRMLGEYASRIGYASKEDIAESNKNAMLNIIAGSPEWMTPEWIGRATDDMYRLHGDFYRSHNQRPRLDKVIEHAALLRGSEVRRQQPVEDEAAIQAAYEEDMRKSRELMAKQGVYLGSK